MQILMFALWWPEPKHHFLEIPAFAFVATKAFVAFASGFEQFLQWPLGDVPIFLEALGIEWLGAGTPLQRVPSHLAHAGG